MKKYLLVLITIFVILAVSFISFSLSNKNGEIAVEKLKIKKENYKPEWKSKHPKIQKEKLVLKNHLRKVQKAEELLEIAIELMSQTADEVYDEKKWGPHPSSSSLESDYVGWDNPNTINILREIIKKYPNSESALEAKLILAIIADNEYHGNNVDYAKELYSEIEKEFPNTWQARYAGYKRIISHVWRNFFADDISPEKAKNMAKELKNYLSIPDKMEKESALLNFIDKINPKTKDRAENDKKFVETGYGLLGGIYCLAGDLENAKEAFRVRSARYRDEKGIEETEKFIKEIDEKGCCPSDSFEWNTCRKKETKEREKQCIDSITSKYPYFAGAKGETLLRSSGFGLEINYQCDDATMWADAYVECMKKLEKKYPNLTTPEGEKLKGQKLLDICKDLRMETIEAVECVNKVMAKYSFLFVTSVERGTLDSESRNVSDCEELNKEVENYVQCNEKMVEKYPYFSTQEGKKMLEKLNFFYQLNRNDCEEGIRWIKNFLEKKGINVEIK